MKRTLMITTLVVGLTVPVLAGDMSTVDSPAPNPSPTPQGMRSVSAPPISALGEMHVTGSAQPSIEDVLDALLSVFGLVF